MLLLNYGMKAMILAAGFGTRLKPLTDNIPKALVPFRNGTIISYQIERLRKAGFTGIVINAHHHHRKIIDYFRDNDFGLNVNVIVEDTILGTGGGIMNAEELLSGDKFFTVINVDVYTDYNILSAVNSFQKLNPLALVTVQKRNTSRYLLFDDDMMLIKRTTDGSNKLSYGFNGIHVISNEIFSKGLTKEYSDIIDLYLGLSEKGCLIKGIDTGNCKFLDLGKPENLKSAESLIK